MIDAKLGKTHNVVILFMDRASQKYFGQILRTVAATRVLAFSEPGTLAKSLNFF